MYNTKTRFILSLLVFLIFFNFTFEYRTRAETIALSAGLILFLKACAATGVTYIAAQEVSKVTQESVELYNEWQKFIKNKPPDKPPVDWEKTVFATLLGLQVSDTFMKLVDSVKDFFKELGAKEGENEYVNDDAFSKGEIEGHVYSTYLSNFFLSDGRRCRYIAISIDGNPFYPILDSTSPPEYSHIIIHSVQILSIKKTGIDSYSVSFEYQESRGGEPYTLGPTKCNVYISSSGDDKVPEPKTINYYFENNSYQFTNDSDDIKPVYPNFDNLPEDKLLTVTDSDGKTSTYYKGTFDDLFVDWQKSQSSGNVFGNRPVIAVETDNGIKIEDDSGSLPDPETPIPEPELSLLELPQKIEFDFSPLHDLVVTDKFPFCLPWDLKRCVEKLVAPGAPPRWEVEIVTGKIVIDFSQFETLATISRSFFSLIYVVTLVIITRKFIGGS